MGTSRVISGPKSGAGTVKTAKPGRSVSIKAPSGKVMPAAKSGGIKPKRGFRK